MADDDGPSIGSGRLKLAVAVLLAVVIGSLVFLFRDDLTLAALAQHEAAFRKYQAAHPVLIYALAFAAYVAVTALSLPGAAGMTILYGWLFAFWRGLLLVSFASTTGATLAFLISRYLLRDTMQAKFGGRLAKINAALEHEGPFYLFTLRLIPVVPFFVLNVIMGLTPIRVRTYWWVSQLGMLPGTAIYAYAGSAVPSLRQLADQGVGSIITFPLLAAFALLGIFPLLIRKLAAAVRKRPAPSAQSPPS